MAKQLKLRRGTTSQHGSFTGAEGEVTVDTDKETLVVHDGSTAGGHPVAAEDMANVSSANILSRINTGAIVGTKLENSGVTAGSYGSSSAIPIVTVDAQGLVTAASTTAIDSTTIANGSSSVAVANNGPITSNANHDFSAGIDVTGTTGTDQLNVSGVSTFQGNVDLGDDDRLRFGAGNDLQIWHNGANSYVSQQSDVGDLYLVSLNDDNDVIIQTDSGDGNTTDYFRADGSTGEAKLFHYGSEKIKTISTGVSVTGIITASGDIQTDGAFRAESSNSTERFEIAYNETTDSLDFSYFAS